MTREKDFEKAAMDYCEDHSHCIYFEAGAEYGYQYAVEKAMLVLRDDIFVSDDIIELFKRAMEEL